MLVTSYAYMNMNMYMYMYMYMYCPPHIITYSW